MFKKGDLVSSTDQLSQVVHPFSNATVIDPLDKQGHLTVQLYNNFLAIIVYEFEIDFALVEPDNV